MHDPLHALRASLADAYAKGMSDSGEAQTQPDLFSGEASHDIHGDVHGGARGDAPAAETTT